MNISHLKARSLQAELPRESKKERTADGGWFSFAGAGLFDAGSEVTGRPDTRGSWTLRFTTEYAKHFI
jgi:hypothetical protein